MILSTKDKKFLEKFYYVIDTKTCSDTKQVRYQEYLQMLPQVISSKY